MHNVFYAKRYLKRCITIYIDDHFKTIFLLILIYTLIYHYADEEASQSTGLSQVRKNFLFCLDDVDVWHGGRNNKHVAEHTTDTKANNHLCQFIKFFRYVWKKG